MGGSIAQPIRRIIYVDPQRYNELLLSGKYDVARIIGRLNRQITDKYETPMMLLGPGRWGSSTPALGIPVNFSEINNICILGEIAYAVGNLIPEISYGSHFFQDLVETNIFYVALFPDEDDMIFNKDFLHRFPNLLIDKVPGAQGYENVIMVYDMDDVDLHLIADVISQRVICFSD